jgi:hypothetical protein
MLALMHGFTVAQPGGVHMTKLMGAALALLVVAPATLAAQAKAKIVSPQQSAAVTGSTVQVVLSSTGVEIAAAALHKAGTAHYHLFLDTNLTPADSAIPMGVAGIVHLGKGQSEYTLEVAPGAHRLNFELADPAHVTLKDASTDTVSFTINP